LIMGTFENAGLGRGRIVTSTFVSSIAGRERKRIRRDAIGITVKTAIRATARQVNLKKVLPHTDSKKKSLRLRSKRDAGAP